MTTHEVLVAARNRLDSVGWFHGGFAAEGHWDGARCLWGTCIRVADVKSVGYHDAGKALVAIVQQTPGWEYQTGWGGLANWNDAPDRTKVEVLDLFDRAIAATAPEPDFASLEAPDAEEAIR